MTVPPVEHARTQPAPAGRVGTGTPAQPPPVELTEPVGVVRRAPSGTHAHGPPAPVEPFRPPAAVRRERVRGWLGRHPEWLALLLAALGWVGLSAALGWLGSPAGWTLPSGHHHGPDASAAVPHAHSLDGQVLIWLAMVVAMMVPTTVPHLRYLGFNTRAARRQGSIALFLLGYLAVWFAPGLALALIGTPPPAALALVLLAAGAWELTPVKRRALRRCCRTWPVGYAGPSADAASVEYGLRHGLVCLLVTGPAMAALALAGHPAWATVALAAVMAGQKLLTRPERWRTAVAIGWLASGVALAGAALSTHA